MCRGGHGRGPAVIQLPRSRAANGWTRRPHLSTVLQVRTLPLQVQSVLNTLVQTPGIGSFTHVLCMYRPVGGRTTHTIMGGGTPGSTLCPLGPLFCVSPRTSPHRQFRPSSSTFFSLRSMLLISESCPSQGVRHKPFQLRYSWHTMPLMTLFTSLRRLASGHVWRFGLCGIAWVTFSGPAPGAQTVQTRARNAQLSATAEW